jgi:hypothetical protein
VAARETAIMVGNAGFDNVRVLGGTVREFIFVVHFFDTSGDDVVVVRNRAAANLGGCGPAVVCR